MSLSKASKVLPASTMVRAYSWVSARVLPAIICNSPMPRMAFIGVRNSCDMVARKRLLARFAASAASLASRRAASCSFDSEMSMKLPM